jgi:hypothetical protein
VASDGRGAHVATNLQTFCLVNVLLRHTQDPHHLWVCGARLVIAHPSKNSVLSL